MTPSWWQLLLCRLFGCDKRLLGYLMNRETKRCTRCGAFYDYAPGQPGPLRITRRKGAGE